MSALWVFIGGGIGALLRYGVGKTITYLFSDAFPLATLLANIFSCIIFALVFYKNPTIVDNQKLFLLTGICGGFSTFSTFSFETFELLKNGQWPWAILNVLISIIACLLVLYFVYRTI